jgi:hypothetical protein
MTLDQIVTVVALIAGPSLGVGISLYLQRREFIRQERIRVFKALLAFRAEPVNPERIRTLAIIDVVFTDKPLVRAKWREYYEALNNPAYANNPNGAFIWMTKQNEMLAEMARAIGYGGSVGYEELARAYAPQAFFDNANLQTAMGKEALRVLQASENFGLPRKPDTAVSQLKQTPAPGDPFRSSS